MKITCVIIDDELKACQLLVGLLKQIPEVEVLKSFTDPQNARLYVLESSPDLSLASLVEMICRFKGKQNGITAPSDLCYGKLRFNTLQGFFLIDLADIVFIQADGNYSIVYLKDGTNKVVTLNLGNMEDRLTGLKFFRMDRSLIINLNSLVHVNRKEHICTLDYNGSSIEFPVNRTRIKQLVEMF